jgi:hypothetical protein
MHKNTYTFGIHQSSEKIRYKKRYIKVVVRSRQSYSHAFKLLLRYIPQNNYRTLLAHQIA